MKCMVMNNFRKAKADDLIILNKLWYEAFLQHDSKESIDYYFENHFDLEHTFVLENNNEILSSLQLNQHQLMYNNEVINISFVVGVSTFLKYRGKGYMKELLNKAIDYARTTLKQEYMILQAYDWDLYRPFGFIDAYYKSINSLSIKELEIYSDDIILDVNEQILLEIYNEYTKKLNGYCIRNLEYFTNQIKLLEVENFKVINSKDAYLFYQVLNDKIIVSECAFKNKEALYSLLKSCLIKEQKNSITFYSDIKNFTSETELFMMIKNLNNDQFLINDKLYISETI